jgi:hypothetical protein
VFGLARSGLATVRAAVSGGAAQVFAWDDRESARQEAEQLGARAVRPDGWPWGELQSLLLSPGVPLTHPQPHPIVRQAQAAGVEIICDIELLWREAEGRSALRRDHRHQRQVDHDRADRARARRGGAENLRRRQYRAGGARPGRSGSPAGST